MRDAMTAGETAGISLAMSVNPLDEVRRHADVERSIGLARENVDETAFFHGPEGSGSAGEDAIPRAARMDKMSQTPPSVEMGPG